MLLIFLTVVDPLDKTVSTMFCILYDEKLYGKEKQPGGFGGYEFSKKNSKYMVNTIDKSTNVLFCLTDLTHFRFSTFFKNLDISFRLLVRASFIQFQYLKYEMLKQNKI
jgi:hypothetical protein